LLQRDLIERFPESHVFMDLDSIEAGMDFADHIRDALDSCAVLVALIGRQWATLADDQGRRRLDFPDDYVRFEVEMALDRGVRVIPVLVDGASPLRQQDLPSDLQKLARLNAFELSYGRYDADSARLLDIIHRVLAAPGPAAVSRTSDAQENQMGRLDDRVLLRMIVSDPERAHLENLRAGSNLDCQRNPSLQAQLRHLRDLRFIRSKRNIGDMPERFNLSEWVELTDEGNEYLRRMAENAQENQPKIFLCYRREDTQGFARGIYDKLADKYGNEQVLRDIDSTPAGVRYSTWIESRVGQCSVMIILIGAAWSSLKDGTGQRRLDLPRDWVRQEIEMALRRGIPIIPVRVQGAPMPSEEELPPSIAELTNFQFAEVTDSRWDYDMRMLIRGIDSLIAQAT
jgi:hypothetical protein